MNKNKYYCKINGTIENLEDIQKLIEKKSFSGQIILAMMDNHGFEEIDAILFEEVLEFNNYEIPADYNECLERMRASNGRRNEAKSGPLVTCPYCHSSNVQKISTTRKAASIIGFGILSNKIGKQWHCNKCKSNF